MGDDSISVVRATGDDVGVAAPLFDAYRQFYGQAPDLAAAAEFLAARMSRAESALFLAVRNGAAIGFTQLYPSFSSVSMRSVWVLNDLFVAAEARQAGAAQCLLQAATEFARQQGAIRLALATAADNTPAQSLYEKLGWRRDDAFWHYEFQLE
ncbi:MAG: GNAT family N-acetyltransferase [Pirellulaceae bacterium]|jgi:GNAT superfamily N-acetyltransferase|nr:GNAT family N-acetyltransferase [Pirellulaceae bacterium]